MENFPGNSHKLKKAPSEKVEPEKATKIIEGVVVTRKTPIGRRVLQTFLGGDAKSAWAYVLYDVIIPSSKDMVLDGFNSGLERLFLGESRSNTRRGYGGRNSSNYNNYQSRFTRSDDRSSRTSRDRDDSRPVSKRGRATHDFSEIILGSRVEAQNVLDEMFQRIEKYDYCGVVDLYEMVGATPDFTDEKWGWMDLRGAGVTRVRTGYLLDLPRPEPLD